MHFRSYLYIAVVIAFSKFDVGLSLIQGKSLILNFAVLHRVVPMART